MTTTLTRAEKAPKSRTASRRCAVSTGSISAVDAWEADKKAFDKWFSKQAYSFGAQPTWTQIEEMKRTWCIARKTLREQK